MRRPMAGGYPAGGRRSEGELMRRSPWLMALMLFLVVGACAPATPANPAAGPGTSAGGSATAAAQPPSSPPGRIKTLTLGSATELTSFADFGAGGGSGGGCGECRSFANDHLMETQPDGSVTPHL